MTKDGIEIVTATDRGEGRMTRLATATYPGTIFFNVLSGAKLAFQLGSMNMKWMS